MLAFGSIVGFFGIALFFFGVNGKATTEFVLLLSAVFGLALIGFFVNLAGKVKIEKINPQFSALDFLIFILLLLLIAVNLIGALGPELGFDALWYHLTLPKLYLQNGIVSYIPGGLLYYSAMPQLGEMYYVFSLAIGNEITAKIIHMSFGILTIWTTYLLAKRFVPQTMALLASLIFYSNLVVSWESTTAYVDLIWAFFTTLAIYSLFLWFEKKEQRFLVFTGFFSGLAISTKLIAIGLIPIVTTLIFLEFFENHVGLKKTTQKILQYLVITISVSGPWFLYAFLNTRNPFFPIFSSRTANYISDYDLNTKFDMVNFGKNIVELFLFSSDPLSPVYIIVFPLLFLAFPKKRSFIYFFIISVLSLFFWYILPKSGGSRFVVPYLPIYSIVVSWLVYELKRKQLTVFSSIVILVIVVTALFTSGYRAVANLRYVPVLLGHESKNVFLARNLNYYYGDFYDVDSFFRHNISSQDKVLLINFHNLFYVDFPFVHESWIAKGESFNYIAVYNGTIPTRFGSLKEIYYNPITKIRVYSDNKKFYRY